MQYCSYTLGFYPCFLRGPTCRGIIYNVKAKQCSRDNIHHFVSYAFRWFRLQASHFSTAAFLFQTFCSVCVCVCVCKCLWKYGSSLPHSALQLHGTKTIYNSNRLGNHDSFFSHLHESPVAYVANNVLAVSNLVVQCYLCHCSGMYSSLANAYTCLVEHE